MNPLFALLLLSSLGGAPGPVPGEDKAEHGESVAASKTDQGEIAVKVHNFRSARGHILLVMFDRESDFPGNSKNAVYKAKKSATGGPVEFTIPNVDYGEYAITVVHDENDNGDLDTNWFGLPIEGFGTSNNAPSNVGPPRYKRAKFRVDSAQTKQSIRLKYFAPDWRPGK